MSNHQTNHHHQKTKTTVSHESHLAARTSIRAEPVPRQTLEPKLAMLASTKNQGFLQHVVTLYTHIYIYVVIQISILGGLFVVHGFYLLYILYIIYHVQSRKSPPPQQQQQEQGSPGIFSKLITLSAKTCQPPT